MCHADQKLHEHVQKGSKEGFWPVDGEVLVGGSYVLLRENAVVKGNISDVAGTEATKVSIVPLSLSSFSLSSVRTDKKAGVGYLTHGRLLAVVRRCLERL